MKNLMAYDLATRRQSCKKNGLFPDDFVLRSPVIQKAFSPKKGITLS